MKQILSFLLFLLPALAFAQWPAAPNKIRLGNQTTGDGLIVRTDSIPNWTPATNRDAWVAFDTVAGVLYYYEGGVWNSFAGGDGNGLFDAANEGDTLLVNTAILSDLGLTLESQDGYTTVDITPGQLKFSVEHSNFRINEQEVEIVASGATAISALENHLILFPDTIELANHLPENNSLTRIVGIDDVTNRLGYIERDSIQTGGGSGMTSFDLAADTGTPETVGDGETATFAGGFGVNTDAGATRTLTFIVDTTEVATISALSDSLAALELTSLAYDSVTTTTLTIDLESRYQKIVQVDMTSASNLTLTIDNPINAGVYTFHFLGVSGTDNVTWPANFYDMNGTALGTDALTAGTAYTCYYDPIANEYYCK